MGDNKAVHESQEDFLARMPEYAKLPSISPVPPLSKDEMSHDEVITDEEDEENDNGQQRNSVNTRKGKAKETESSPEAPSTRRSQSGRWTPLGRPREHSLDAMESEYDISIEQIQKTAHMLSRLQDYNINLWSHFVVRHKIYDSVEIDKTPVTAQMDRDVIRDEIKWLETKGAEFAENVTTIAEIFCPDSVPGYAPAGPATTSSFSISQARSLSREQSGPGSRKRELDSRTVLESVEKGE